MTVTATFVTTKGTFKARLMPDHAPKTVANFTDLATGKREWRDPRSGRTSTDRMYDGTVFHRVIKEFMMIMKRSIYAARSTRFSGSVEKDAILSLCSDQKGLTMRFAVLHCRHCAQHVWVPEEKLEGITTVATDGQDRPREAVVLERVDVDEA